MYRMRVPALHRVCRVQGLQRAYERSALGQRCPFGSEIMRQQRLNLGLQQRAPRDERTREASGHLPENAVHTREIMNLARERRWLDAQALFERIPEKNIIVYCAIITAACRCKRYSEGLHYFEQLRASPLEMNAACYGSAMAILGCRGDVKGAQALSKEMAEKGFDVLSPPCVTALLNAAAVAGDIASVKEQLAEYERQGVDLNETHLGCLVKACREARQPHDAMEALNLLRARTGATVVHYTMVVGSLSTAAAAGTLPSGLDVGRYIEEVTQLMKADQVQPDCFFVEEQVRALMGGVDLKAIAGVPQEQMSAALRALETAAASGVRLTRLLQEVLHQLSTPSAASASPLSSPAQPGAAMSLPHGWSSAVDPSSGLNYYWMTSDPTNTTTWERPQA
eukprot:TRINITY_DN29220_c0_g1_i1.p1 TRINITY_DN29220_c0_g1~~TRINITY_DN29220_c0_g1_i1.p1  ORF type:complete len:396 (+),score=79.29 TRINITY_DN29220_c0_g1_i1:91-1278(+)